MTRRRRLEIVLLLNLALIAGLAVVGLSAHSIGVLAEGGDYIADAAAIGVSLVAIRLSERPPTASRPRDYPRATNWAAGVNAAWLVILCVLILIGSVARLRTGAGHVDGVPVVVVSGVAALVMLAGALILRGDIDGDTDGEVDLNLRAVLLDTAGDAAAALGVAIAGAIILGAHGMFWLDPAVAATVAIVIGWQAVLLLLQVRRRLRIDRSSG